MKSNIQVAPITGMSPGSTSTSDSNQIVMHYEWNRAKLSNEIAWDRATSLLRKTRIRNAFGWVLLGFFFLAVNTS